MDVTENCGIHETRPDPISHALIWAFCTSRRGQVSEEG